MLWAEDNIQQPDNYFASLVHLKSRKKTDFYLMDIKDQVKNYV